ncbi:hypothetical protein DITRI_Ditri17bG0101600 [Diplodiscus trichospermus]
MIAAASDAIWDNGAACGRKYKVTCIGATNQHPHPCIGKRHVVVKIVDYCPSQVNYPNGTKIFELYQNDTKTLIYIKMIPKL